MAGEGHARQGGGRTQLPGGGGHGRGRAGAGPGGGAGARTVAFTNFRV
jgi:hypothetical protein